MNNPTPIRPVFRYAMDDERVVLVKECAGEQRTITLDNDEAQELLEALLVRSQSYGEAS